MSSNAKSPSPSSPSKQELVAQLDLGKLESVFGPIIVDCHYRPTGNNNSGPNVPVITLTRMTPEEAARPVAELRFDGAIAAALPPARHDALMDEAYKALRVLAIKALIDATFA
jgi:hypothetical protein